MRPTKFLLLTALSYGTLLIIFGLNQGAPTPSRHTAVSLPPIVYSPITTAPVSVPRTAAPQTTTTAPAPLTLAPVPIVGPDTPCQEWVPAALDAGWPENREIIETLMSVMWRESRCDPAALSKSSDHGLLQVNEIHRAYVEQIWGVPFEVAMADPYKNLHFAWLLYSEREAEGKCGWQPWSLKCQ